MTPNLHILAASQTRDKDALTQEGVGKIIDELKQTFDFIICDSPAGIESGAMMAMHFADTALVVTNPEVSSVRDSDRILGMLASKTKAAQDGEKTVKEHLVITRYSAKRADKGEMLSIADIQELLGIELAGIIPESQAVLNASNSGQPVIIEKDSDAGKAYDALVSRFLGEPAPPLMPGKKQGFFKRLFNKEEVMA